MDKFLVALRIASRIAVQIAGRYPDSDAAVLVGNIFEFLLLALEAEKTKVGSAPSPDWASEAALAALHLAVSEIRAEITPDE